MVDPSVAHTDISNCPRFPFPSHPVRRCCQLTNKVALPCSPTILKDPIAIAIGSLSIVGEQGKATLLVSWQQRRTGWEGKGNRGQFEMSV